VKINQLACLLVPVLALSLPTSADNWEKTDDDGSSFIFGRGETTTAPGGFSAVAEPAGPLAHSRPTRMTPGQLDSNYYRNLVTVQLVYCRLLRHYTIKDFQGTTSNF